MGCAQARLAAEEEEASSLVDQFLALADEAAEEGWNIRSPEVGATTVDWKEVNGSTYWRGQAKVNAPAEVVQWFLGNQCEFNALRNSVERQVLDPEVAKLYAKGTNEVIKAKRGTRKLTSRWTLHLPDPLLPREFLVTERSRALRDGTMVTVATSKPRNKASESGDGERTTQGGDTSGGSQGWRHSNSVRDSIRDSLRSSMHSLREAALRRRTGGAAGSEKMSVYSALLSRRHQSASAAVDADSPGAQPEEELEGDGAPAPRSLSARLSVGKRPRSLERTPPRPAVREGKLVVSGFVLRPAADGKSTTVTFLSCIDARLSDDECEALLIADSEAGSAAGHRRKLVDELCGRSRVLSMLESPRRYFEDPKSLWMQQFFRLATAARGEFGFRCMDAKRRGEAKMQTGTHVKHRHLGHGVVKQFDLSGHAQVLFDSGAERVFGPEQLGRELSAAVEVGSRVRTNSGATGTVKQFDDARIHVRFDNGEYRRYDSAAWEEHIQLTRQTDMASNVELSRCRQPLLEGITSNQMLLSAGVSAPRLGERRRTRARSLTRKVAKRTLPRTRSNLNRRRGAADMLRISFLIAAPTELVLDYVRTYKEHEKAGNVLREAVEAEHSSSHKTRYQRVRLPQGLNDRDFVFDEVWGEVDKDAFAVVAKSTELHARPPVPGVVRGEVVLRGFLLEPMYDADRLSRGETLFTRVTYLTCVEPKGFVPPKVVESLNRTELLGAMTDMRAYFYRLEGSGMQAGARLSKHATQLAKGKIKRRSLRRASTLGSA